MGSQVKVTFVYFCCADCYCWPSETAHNNRLFCDNGTRENQYNDIVLFYQAVIHFPLMKSNMIHDTV